MKRYWMRLQPIKGLQSPFDWHNTHNTGRYSWINLLFLLLVAGVIFGCGWIALTPITAHPVEIVDWSSVGELQRALASHTAAVHGNAIYVVGGKTSDGKAIADVRSTLILPDGALSEWKTLPPLPYPLSLHALATTDRQIYAIGGWDDKKWHTEIWRAAFSATGNLEAWSQVKDCNRKLALHDAVAYNNKWLYVVGGQTDNLKISNKICFAEILPDSSQWIWQETDMPLALYKLSVVAYNGYLYITGGLDKNDTPQSKLYYAKIDETNGSLGNWQTATLPENKSRFYHRALIYENQLLVIGGKESETGNKAELNTVYVAPLDGTGKPGEWQPQPSLPESRYRFAAVTMQLNNGQIIYLLGGLHSEGDYRSTIYRSALPTATPTQTPTPPPTPTSTPAPGIEAITLSNAPTGSITMGGELTYTINFTGNHLKNDNLTHVWITDTIPANTQLITTSILPTNTMNVTYTGVEPGKIISWKLPELLDSESRSVSYRVRRLSAQSGVATIVDTSAAISSAEDVLYNDGVDIAWTYQDIERIKQSNSTCNPSPCSYQYLPIIGK